MEEGLKKVVDLFIISVFETRWGLYGVGLGQVFLMIYTYIFLLFSFFRTSRSIMESPTFKGCCYCSQSTLPSVFPSTFLFSFRHRYMRRLNRQIPSPPSLLHRKIVYVFLLFFFSCAPSISKKGNQKKFHHLFISKTELFRRRWILIPPSPIP